MIEAIGEWFTGPSRADLREEIEQLEYRVHCRDSTIRDLRKQITNLNEAKEEAMFTGTNLVNQYPLDKKDAQFRVIESRPGVDNDYFVAKSYRKTYDEALELARKLATQFPQNTYYVSGVLAAVKAEIPVASTAFFVPATTPDKKVDSANQG